MKTILTIILFSFLSVSFIGQDNHSCRAKHDHNSHLKITPSDFRGDSIDITHLDITLELHDFDDNIYAQTQVDFQALVNNIDEIRLDLLGFTVDSITTSASSLTFDYDMELLIIHLDDIMMLNDEQSITVYYHGEPTTDPSGFGGFYMTNSYIYNLGVGFNADPHNYGRTWFPCFDNFVERSTFTYHILTDSTNFVYANGNYIDRVLLAEDTLVTTWVMEEEIPSYLASIGVSTYTHVNMIFEGVEEDVPVMLIAKPNDTTNMKNSFVNLPIAFETFESRFGPYQWNKVAFNLVPNNSGAMEHASCIAYPKIIANGNLSYQSIMAHELAHHWWGDLVTCSSQEDMWINEGMASYCEQLFFESLGGYDSYVDHVKDNHKDVFFDTADDDGEWLPVAGIGHEYTYSSTVYNKGSDVAHVLRSYLGDDDFFSILTNFIEDNQFSDVSSIDFRDYIQLNTDADMTAYFDNWIFAPGFPEFSIVNQTIEEEGDLFNISLTVDQQLYHAPSYYTNVPMVVRVMNADYETEDFLVLLEDESTDIEIISTIDPAQIFLNPQDKISQAVFGEVHEVDELGTENMSFPDFRIDVDDLGENNTIWIRPEVHYADADINDETEEFKVSDDRYWRVRIQNTNPFAIPVMEGRIKFNGNENSSNYNDETFFIFMEDNNLNEDSLVLVHRIDASAPWEMFGQYDINTSGSNDNWVGSIDIPMLVAGDYAWAYRYSSVVTIDESIEQEFSFIQSRDLIQVTGVNKNYDYVIHNAIGQLIDSGEFFQKLSLETTSLKSGTYFIKINGENIEQRKAIQFIIE